MRRRFRIDLGQQVDSKEATRLERKRQRWNARNKDRPPHENPFLVKKYSKIDEDLRKQLDNYEFGNFVNYFNYRRKAQGIPDQTVEDESNPLEAGLTDERLESLKSEWFEGKLILDIGCNRGHISYAIGKKFSPKFVLGADIDPKVIRLANKDLKATRNSEDLVHKQCSAMLGIDQNMADVPNTDGQLKFPNNIYFIDHNYVLDCDYLVRKQEPYFDTIICLSVTKWIHLNYCDDGLKRFFRRIYRNLKPGGLFVLEAQPFDNYGRRKKLSDRLKANYYSIKFKPDQFDDYLLGPDVGFKEIIYSTTTDHKCAGFKRPLKVFLK